MTIGFGVVSMKAHDLPVICIVDLETTSAKAETAGVVQIAALAMYPWGPGFSIQPLFETYCQPSFPMTAEAEKINGITRDKYRLASSEAMAVWLLGRAVSGLGSNVILSGFNSNRYDYPIIERIAPTTPLRTLQRIDVMDLAIRRDAGQSYKLTDVFQQTSSWDEEFKNFLLAGAHGALADCWMVAIVLDEWMKERVTVDAREVVEELSVPKQLKLMPHGKYRGVPFNEVPASYLSYAASTWADMAPDLKYTFKQLGLI
jgi:hypothetical protein